MKQEAPEYTGKQPPKVLIVDDKRPNLVALEKVLKDVNAELIKANSGNEALQKTLEHEFALALIDVQMPEMDGYELAELMRSDEKTASIPIIFISAIYTERLNIFKGYESGAFSFITKPFEPKELLNKVHFFINKYHTEKAYDQSRLKYKELYHSSPDMMISVDLDTGAIKECNQTLLNSLGYKREEVIDVNLAGLCAQEDQKKVKEAFEQFKKKGELFNTELTLETKDGEQRKVQLNARGLLQKEHPLQSNFSLSDITELKKTQDQLEQALAQVQQKNEDLKNFVYLTSHDLQEPMLTVLSFINLLEEEYGQQLDPEAAEYISYCMQAANRMKELISSLLDYLRIGQEEVREEVDMNWLINKVNQELKGVIRQSGAKVQVSDLPVLSNVGENHMKQLFQNLISNSIKFRKPDVPPEINISVQKQGNYHEFQFQDNGVGIHKKNQNKAFQMFKQMQNRDVSGGLGVGLPICKKIVENYEGSIWMDSKEGEGTTFYFTLPE